METKTAQGRLPEGSKDLDGKYNPGDERFIYFGHLSDEKRQDARTTFANEW